MPCRAGTFDLAYRHRRTLEPVDFLTQVLLDDAEVPEGTVSVFISVFFHIERKGFLQEELESVGVDGDQVAKQANVFPVFCCEPP